MARNPHAKLVPLAHAYEVWQSADGSETYYVRKRYQHPEKEANNPFAKWYVTAFTPHTSSQGDSGDMYAINCMADRIKIDNPLCVHVCITPATKESLADMGFANYRFTPLVNLEPRLVTYIRLSIPKEQVTEVLSTLQENGVCLVADTDVEFYIEACLADFLRKEHTDG